MNPLIHYLGSSAIYGWLLPNPSGIAADYGGLLFRVLVFAENAAPLAIPAYLTSGEVLVLDEPVDDPAVTAFDLDADSIDLPEGTYRAVRQLDHSCGGRAIPASEFCLKLRRLDS